MAGHLATCLSPASVVSTWVCSTHALSCAEGGFPTVRHVMRSWMSQPLFYNRSLQWCLTSGDSPPTEWCLSTANCSMEPGLISQPMKSGGGGQVWKELLRCKSTEPPAPTNRNLETWAPPTCMYWAHECAKERAYGERAYGNNEQQVREVEHSSFTPL